MYKEKSYTEVFSITIWLKIEKLFYAHFFSINTKVEVINKLEKSLYYQGSYVVEDYLDKFQVLIAKTSYTNFYTIIVKFRRDLQTNIQS